jgi:hypothetical protein
VRDVDPDFVAASGFIAREGVGSVNLDHRITLYDRPGSFIETYGGDIRLSDTWAGRALTAGHAPEDRRWSINSTATLHGGWVVGGAVYLESYGYDPALYSNYYLGRISGADTTFIHLPNQKAIPNTDLIVNVTTPQFAHFSASVVDVFGRDENFAEWSSADFQLPQIAVTWQPTQQFRVNGTYNAQIYRRHSDGSLVAQTLIPRLEIAYQLSRSIFIRVVGEYDAVFQDSLRDDSRTNLPIFIFSPSTGAYVRAIRSTSNVLSGQFLFSYQPVPGTVAFIGYGNDSNEPSTLRFNDLRRQADNFFVKFSYLFRLH